MIEKLIDKANSNQKAEKYVRRLLENAPLSLIYKTFRKKDIMVSGIIRDAKSKNIDVRQAELADLAEERLYRGVCYLTMVGQLVRLFNDYNVARREAKGEESAASKFIGNDISEVITLLNTVRANNRITDERFMGVQDKVFALVEYMTGRRDLIVK